MRRFFKQLITLTLASAMILTPTTAVMAKSKTYTEAMSAYTKVLRNLQYDKDEKAYYFEIMDLNDDGIPELIADKTNPEYDTAKDNIAPIIYSFDGEHAVPIYDTMVQEVVSYNAKYNALIVEYE